MKHAAVIVLVLAAAAAATPANAGGLGHGHGYPHHGFVRHGHGDYAAVVLGGVILGALVGSLHHHPAPRYYAPAQPVLGNCRPVTGTGFANGLPALFGGTGCYDAYGNFQIVRGSEHFLRYLR